MSQEILFICGFPSSGTDLLRNVLNAHPQINIGGEFPFLPTLATDFSAEVSADNVGAARRAIERIDTYGLLKNAAAEFPAEKAVAFSELFAGMLFSDQSKWTGTKTPQNTENMDQLLHLFPNARFIIVVRDIRDVALSWRKKWGKSITMCAEKWNARMLAGAETTSALKGHQYMYVTYEDLISQLEREATRICEFLGLAFDSRILEFQQYVTEKVPGKINFGEAIVQDNSGKWVDAFKPGELTRIEEIAWNAMQEFGYKPTLASGPATTTRLERFRGSSRDIYALIAVGNRTLESRRLSSRLAAIKVLLLKLVAKARGQLN